MRSTVAAAERTLAMAGVVSPEVDARRLACFVLGVENLALVSNVPPSFEAEYAAVVQRRAEREPLQLIVGSVPFRHIDVLVEQGVFIPRPETELVAGAAIDEARTVLARQRSVRVVDLCAGTGAIALSVAFEVPAAEVIAVEVDSQAQALARRNAAALGLTNLHVRYGDIADVCSDLTATVDVVVSNPPYVPGKSAITEPEVLRFDPPLALYGGGEAGFDLPAQVIFVASRLLRPGGLLVFEHDSSQGTIARATFAASSEFSGEQTYRDLAGHERFSIARRVLSAVGVDDQRHRGAEIDGNEEGTDDPFPQR